jgi:hypothetical protein
VAELSLALRNYGRKKGDRQKKQKGGKRKRMEIRMKQIWAETRRGKAGGRLRMGKKSIDMRRV